ncbi:Ni/Fe-hydrogenase, b-type cytochrome subunit [Flavobacterium sp. PL02]|uniref:Ni/Fe-hydrogenase, b-type cytochrome subunit n=1 Tax=Flavobacterium sp. PL02 TaxID=3088354 RepID=UPI002B2284DC|nr:Ni/Fe-hydrogenase, b-type cytochrome subunit [Flavobacterium sp. PL02]MEA9411839.1 Ni/Fe-hydrogenase, b-type cytochrome subunit [Flavobacterium sp. PL02]
MPTKTNDYKRAYIWQLPVRIFHWVNAWAITGLVATGFIIANPPGIISSKEATEQFWFGYVREIHFICAYLLVAVMILRVYFAFKGNKYANWRVFLPFKKEGFKRMWHVIKYDIFLQNEETNNSPTGAVGHNSVAAASYLVMFFMGLVMIATGFAMYAPTSTWFLPKMFGWVVNLLGGDFNVRTIHHITTWAFILFAIVHVYLVFFHDWLEGLGETSAMVSGYKFVRTERVRKDEIANDVKEVVINTGNQEENKKI